MVVPCFPDRHLALFEQVEERELPIRAGPPPMSFRRSYQPVEVVAEQQERRGLAAVDGGVVVVTEERIVVAGGGEQMEGGGGG